MDLHFTPTRCFIDLDAIIYNFRQLGEPADLMPVIKADAYGHGLAEVADALLSADARAFAVGLAGEGVALRKRGIVVPITLLMGCHTQADWENALVYNLTPVIGSRSDLEVASALMTAHPNRTLEVALKCDTGMGRLGFNAEDAGALADALHSIPGLKPVLALSHLACADMPENDHFTFFQFQSFEKFFETLKAAFPELKPSLNNSAGIIRQLPGGIGRPGLALYGGNPLGKHSQPALKWAMSVAAPILAVHYLSPGESVSYGRLFTASKTMTVAVVPVGYATGYSRKLSGEVSMLVHGQRCAQIGRICMSMAMLDVSLLANPQPGDLAWLLGGPAEGDQEAIDAWELADKLGTIPYEILCLLGSLTPRVYHGES